MGSASSALGRKAQKKAASLVADADLTVTESGDDLHGWDLLVEFPGDSSLTDDPWYPHGRPEMSCLVQVKGTRASSRVQVKLSNLKRLVEHPLPCFFLILVYGRGNTPREAYLVHVDHALSERVLKRLRHVAAAGEDELHRKKMDVRWRDHEQVRPLVGTSIAAAIRGHIKDQAEYVLGKQQLLKTIGYDERPVHVSFQVKAGSNEELYEMFVDWAIGLVDEIPAQEVRASIVRFGVPLPDWSFPGGDGTFRVNDRSSTSPGRAQVVVRAHDDSVVASFGGDLFLPTWLGPAIPRSFMKCRIRSDVAEVVATMRPSSKGRLRVELPDYHTPTELATLIAKGTLIKAMGRSTNEEALRIAIEYAGATIEVRAPTGLLLDSEHSVFAETLSALSGLLERLSIDPTAVVVPAELLAQRQRIREMGGLVACESAPEKRLVTKASAIVDPSEFVLGASGAAALVALTGLVVGGSVHFAILALTGKPATELVSSDALHVRLPHACVNLIDVGSVPRESWSSDVGRIRMDACVKQMQAKGYFVIRAEESPAQRRRPRLESTADGGCDAPTS